VQKLREVLEPLADRVSAISHCHTATTRFKLCPSLFRIFFKKLAAAFLLDRTRQSALAVDIKTETD
jgi:hypothetical protein